MILVDKLRSYKGKRKKYTHMVSDKSLMELHYFAAQIGVKRHWFHKGDHYDIREEEYEKALNAGATIVNAREITQRRVSK